MKIAVLASGGVDSSVTLALLKNQGHDVTAFYLKIWLEDDVAHLGECPWEDDVSYVKKVCEQLDVPLQILNLQQAYWDKVVSYALHEVKQGRTPNPDMMCNTRVKFGAFYDAIGDDYDKIATGHYADVEERDGISYLKRVSDPIKDQTYFLAHLTQSQLQKALFPIGTYTKKEVRDLAHTFDLPNKDRKDSQGICFLGKIKYSDFIAHYLGVKKGDMVDIDTGKILKQHDGYWYHTIGQRKGTGLGHGPWYVVKKDVEKNIVYVSNTYEEKSRRECVVRELSWIVKPQSFAGLKVKVRHGPKLYDAAIEVKDDARLRVILSEDDQGLASGQFVVFYDDTYCYGCGVIE